MKWGGYTIYLDGKIIVSKSGHSYAKSSIVYRFALGE